MKRNSKIQNVTHVKGHQISGEIDKGKKKGMYNLYQTEENSFLQTLKG